MNFGDEWVVRNWIKTCLERLFCAVQKNTFLLLLLLVSHLRLSQRINDPVVEWLNLFDFITLYQQQPIGSTYKIAFLHFQHIRWVKTYNLRIKEFTWWILLNFFLSTVQHTVANLLCALFDPEVLSIVKVPSWCMTNQISAIRRFLDDTSLPKFLKFVKNIITESKSKGQFLDFWRHL